MSKNKWVWLVMVGGLLVSAPLMAAKKDAEFKVVNATPATTAEEFSGQAQRVREGMEQGGRFAEITTNNKKRVDELLAQISSLLTSGSFAELPTAGQMDLINAQEEANAILMKNDGQRLICTHERPTGTKFKQKVCRTAAEIAERRRVDSDLNNFSRGVPRPENTP